MRTEKKFNRALRRAAQMPPLALAQPDGTFDLKQSEVVRWFLDQPEIVNHFVDAARNAGAIVFDKESGKWRGRHYGEIDTSLESQ